MDRREVEAKPGIGRGRARGRLRNTSPLGLQSPTSSVRSTGVTSSDDSSLGVQSSSTSTAHPLPGMSKLNVSGVSDAVLQGGFPRGAQRGKLHVVDPKQVEEREARRDFVKSRPEGLKKQGEKGQRIQLKANYYRLKTIPSWHLHQYAAHFSVEEDRIGLRKKLFRKYVTDNQLELGYMFDGAQLFTSKTLEQAGIPASFTVKLDREEDQPNTINFVYVGVVDQGSPIYVQLYNILIRKCLFTLDLQQMGRNFFDAEAAITLPKEKLQLWPGYITSMRAHENDVLLCIETTTKVLRMDSVLQLIQRTQAAARGDPKSAIRDEFKDTIVMTTYNKKTYHVDDIDFDLTPKSTFMRKGVETSYAEYYESKYGLKIRDMNQPLIISNPRGRDLHRGDDKPAILVPELCQSTGLTDAMRSNFTLMKDLAKYLHQMPKEKASVIEKFMRRLQENDMITKEFQNWGLHFDGKLVDLNGRVLGNETMVFATGTQPVDPKGDFTMAFRSQQMLTAVQMTNWVVLVPVRDAGGVDNLVRTMSKVANPLSMKISNPKQIFNLPDIKPQTYLRQIDEAVKNFKDLQMLFVILPNNGLPLYAAVKKRLAVDLGIPSQCFLAKNVVSKGLMSIATKVVVQMNAKLGGMFGLSKKTPNGKDDPDRDSKMGLFIAKMITKPNVYSAISTPLPSPWTFWISGCPKGSGKDEYLSGLQKVKMVFTTSQFWKSHRSMTKPSRLNGNDRVKISMMRDDRSPIWEHPYNQNGGCFVARMERLQMDWIWEQLLVLAVGENLDELFDPEDELCGITISTSSNSNIFIIAFWNRNAERACACNLYGFLRSRFPFLTIIDYFYNAHKNHVAYEASEQALTSQQYSYSWRPFHSFR